MKFRRFLAAFLAAAVVFTSVGCADSGDKGETPDNTVSGDTNSGSDTEDRETETTTASKKKDKDKSKDKDKDKTDDSSKDTDKEDEKDYEPSGGTVSSSDKKKMIAVVQDMYKASQDEDMIKLLGCLFPDAFVECIKDVNGEDLLSDGLFGEVDAGFDVSKITIGEIEDVDEKILEGVSIYYNAIIESFKVLEEKGYDLKKMDSGEYSQEEVREIYDIMGSMNYISDPDNVKKTVNVTDVKQVTLSNSESGADEPIWMYKVKGEGWKIDCLVASMMGYVMQSKDKAANSTASSACKAANSAAADLDEMNEDVFGDALICSDSSKTKLGKGCKIDEKKFKEYMVRYFDELENCNYFIVMGDGVCRYAVVEYNGTTGAYPVDKILTSVKTGYEYDGLDVSKKSFAELVDMCAGLIS